MNLIVDINKALYHSSITRARCGKWIHVSYSDPKLKNQKELHEIGCPECQESYSTGILPDYDEMERLEKIEIQEWMKEYAEKNKEK